MTHGCWQTPSKGGLRCCILFCFTLGYKNIKQNEWANEGSVSVFSSPVSAPFPFLSVLLALVL